MKFFGWGRKKDPPPRQHLQQQVANKSDSSTSHGPMAAAPDRWGPHNSFQGHRSRRASKEYSFEHRRTAFAGDDDGADRAHGDWEDRLQETIRFVFSHEQEGLLAIGTFALDQLAGARGDLGRSSGGDFASSDEDRRRSGWAPASDGAKPELPVFGDPKDAEDASSGDSDADAATRWDGPCGAAPIVLLTAASQRADALAASRPGKPPAEVRPAAAAKEEAFSGEEYYATGVCGLFSSRRRPAKSVKGKRSARAEQPKIDGESRSRKKAAGKGGRSLGKFGRLWWSSCNGSTAKVVPEKKPSLPMNAPPCIANRADSGNEEGRASSQPGGRHCNRAAQPTGPSGSTRENRASDDPKRRSGGGAGWACDEYGKWIKTDSEFVVLEM